MKVAVALHKNSIDDWDSAVDFAVGAEKLGVDSLWSAEGWTHDAATPLAYLMAKTTSLRFGSGIFQVGTRTPGLIAMTAQTLDSLSGGRFMLGLGTSGPQVIEGWHGIPFSKPVLHTKEVIEICRKIFAGEKFSYDGHHWQLPLTKERGGTGLSKSLSPSATPTPDLPIYVASLGPKNLHMTGQFADGWLGTVFLPDTADVFLGPIKLGAEEAGRSISDIDILVGARVQFSEDVEKLAEELKPGLAFQVGAMGTKNQNFYADAYRRQGWADEVSRIQSLWIAGRRDEARTQVPTEMALSGVVVGSPTEVKEKLIRYKQVGVNTFRVDPAGSSIADRLDTLEETMKIINEIS
tara:strand:+ start:2194 stop:3246 length:1053 start_codon:yes stop_codon:yes gene_type:complete